MKKLFVSDYVGFDESATKAAMYSFDSEEECKEFLELSHDERCQVFMFLMRATTMGFYPERLTTYTSLLLSVGFLLCMILLP